MDKVMELIEEAAREIRLGHELDDQDIIANGLEILERALELAPQQVRERE